MQALHQRRRRALGECPARPRQHLPEALPAVGLEQVFESLDLEGGEGVLIECGDEYGERHLLHADGTHHAEAVETRHLYVEKHQVGPGFAQEDDGGFPIPRLADDLDPVLELQHAPQLGPGWRLVVDDRHPDHGKGSANARELGARSAVPGSIGSSARTPKPPSGWLPASNRCRSP